MVFPVGFPSGALANVGPFEALQFFQKSGISAPEIHPREPGDDLFRLGREMFENASIHLPSYPHTKEEDALVIAREAMEHGYQRLIIHPYVIKTPELWLGLGSALVLENMDFRSPGFMTADDMLQIYQSLPAACFCLDVGHTHSWNPGEAANLIEGLSDRLVCVHYSEVDQTNGDHLPDVSDEVISSHARYLKLLPASVPVILEVGKNPAEGLLDLRRRFSDSLA